MSKAIYYVQRNNTGLSMDLSHQAISIVMGDVVNKTTLLTSLAQACHFPSYFSHNWDSAWDCLTDSSVSYLTLDLTDVKKIDNEDFNVFKSMIEDAYRDFGKPQLWIIMPSEYET